MANRLTRPTEEFIRDAKTNMYNKELAKRHNISESWASLLRARIGHPRRVPKKCPFCRRTFGEVT